MYLGRVVETGTREQVFAHPRHPYSAGASREGDPPA
jgi:ABC-type oligopeptide transport system ATPase subunit